MLCGSGVREGLGVCVTSGGLCNWTVWGGVGVYLKALRLLMMWFPTSVLRPKARQSTTVMLRGGWRCSFSGNSCQQSGQRNLKCSINVSMQRMKSNTLSKQKKLSDIHQWRWLIDKAVQSSGPESCSIQIFVEHILITRLNCLISMLPHSSANELTLEPCVLKQRDTTALEFCERGFRWFRLGSCYILICF